MRANTLVYSKIWYSIQPPHDLCIFIKVTELYYVQSPM